ncbi:MAG: hypothetical protein IPO21_04360 [Bacteroidales bacterium]|nr:hypothetical protein [Bacteroidales bacterium]
MEVNYIDKDGCVATATQTITVETVSTPQVTGNTASEEYLYPSVPSSYQLQAQGSGGELKWFTDAAATVAYGTGASIVPAETQVSEHDYYVYEQNSIGCKSDTVRVLWIVTPCVAPEQPVVSEASHCANEPIQTLTATVGDSGLLLEWFDVSRTKLLKEGTSFTPDRTAMQTGNNFYYVQSREIIARAR